MRIVPPATGLPRDTKSRKLLFVCYLVLALVIAAAVIYQVRYTIYPYPTWFGEDILKYPFSIYPDPKKPDFLIYTYATLSNPGIRNGDTILVVNGNPMGGAEQHDDMTLVAMQILAS